MPPASKIIFLNGVSSSGKTTIAKLLQKSLPEPFLHVCIDAFEEMMPTEFEGRRFTYIDVLNNMIPGMHDCIRSLSAAGNNLIVDHILIDDCEPSNWVSSGLECLTPFPHLMVAVKAPLSVLRQREALRDDRREGLAEWQLNRVHGGIAYDLEVDTSEISSEECVRRIIAAATDKLSVAG